MIALKLIKLTGKLVKKGKPMSAAQKAALRKAIAASAKSRSANKKIQKAASTLSKNARYTKAASKGLNDSVFRMQTKAGTGFVNKKVLPPKGVASTNHKLKPFPVGKSQKNFEQLKKSAPDFAFEKLDFDRGIGRFGFKNMQQANRYFTPAEINWYKSKGYTIQQINNVKITAQSKNQLVFIDANDLRTINKQDDAILKKYSKYLK